MESCELLRSFKVLYYSELGVKKVENGFVRCNHSRDRCEEKLQRRIMVIDSNFVNNKITCCQFLQPWCPTNSHAHHRITPHKPSAFLGSEQ